MEDEKHSGYYGWSNGIVRNGEDYTPTKVQTGSASIAAKTGSAWNHCGTWEEKDKTEWGISHLKELLLKRFDFTKEGVAYRATAVSKCTGEAKIVYSRGKKRCGFDLSLVVEWEANGIGGKVTIHEFEDSNGEEIDMVISCKDGGVKKGALALEGEICEILHAWKRDLLMQ